MTKLNVHVKNKSFSSHLSGKTEKITLKILIVSVATELILFLKFSGLQCIECAQCVQCVQCVHYAQYVQYAQCVQYAHYAQYVQYAQCVQYAHYAQYEHHKLRYTTPNSVLLSTNQSTHKQQTYQVTFLQYNCILSVRSVLLY
jgi:hypothetical protein